MSNIGTGTGPYHNLPIQYLVPRHSTNIVVDTNTTEYSISVPSTTVQSGVISGTINPWWIQEKDRNKEAEAKRLKFCLALLGRIIPVVDRLRDSDKEEDKTLATDLEKVQTYLMKLTMDMSLALGKEGA